MENLQKDNIAKVKTNAVKNKMDEWYTPKFIVNRMEETFNLKFDYDPATTKKQAEYLGIKNFDTEETNSLNKVWWYKNIWLNPPFSLKRAFLEKAVDQFNLINMENMFILIPEYTMTNVYVGDLLDRLNGNLNIIFLKGRLQFETLGSNTDYKDLKIYKMKSPIFGSIILHFSRKFDYRIKFLSSKI